MTKITTVVEQIVVNIEQPVHKIVVRVGGGGGGGPVDWDNVQNKPGEFPPSAHTHEISEVAGLEEWLSGLSVYDLAEFNAGGLLLNQPFAFEGPEFAIYGNSVNIVGTGDEGSVSIITHEGSGQQKWAFKPDGTIVFPDATVQRTAGAHITVSATPPSDPAENDLWYDTTAPLAERLKYFDGADWA